MSVQRSHEALRACNFCGFEAYIPEDLELFRKSEKSKYGRVNTCKTCYNEVFNSKYNQRRKKVSDEPEPLRFCRKCGLKVWNEENLKLFRKNKRLPYGRETICKECYNEENYRKPWREAIRTLRDPPLCFNCSIDDIRVLSIDHIDNNGSKERDAYRLHRDIVEMGQKEALKHYQILCRNCNWEKFLDHSGIEPCRSERWAALTKICDSPYCVECDETDVKYLSIDHIKNNGYEEYSEIGHVSVYRLISKRTREEARKDYQILCRNCNWIRRREVRNEC